MNAMRRSFAIRSGLNETMLDTVVPLSFGGSEFKLKKELTVRTMLFLLTEVIVFFFICFQTPLVRGGILPNIIWITGYWWFGWLIARPTPTGLLGYTYFLAALKYFNPDFRKLPTRVYQLSAPAVEFVGIATDGIDEDGNIYFANGDIGQIYELTGNASFMIFEEDKIRVLNDARVFYRGINPLTTITYDTVSSPQRVDNQLKVKQWQIDNLTLKQSNLLSLLQREKKALNEVVGKQFTTLHQYMVVRSVNLNELRVFVKWLTLAANSDSLFLKSAVRLDSRKEVINYFGSIYSNRRLNN